ncbi:hypothetical protein [Cytobacillus firmus]|uniref:hypothetical protein n=1 Tax=Cytobacillus firmus TaxID=1399 RepID=UPI002228155C|nr:hypothetical protein [Cytobacillus firmus]
MRIRAFLFFKAAFILGSFGQEKKKSEGVSPKLALVRTGEEEIRGSESEVEASSDRKREKQGARIQS